MHKRFDTGKQPYDAAKDTQATAPSHKPLDFIRLSSESTRENPRLLGGTVNTDKPVKEFFTSEELHYMYQHQSTVEGSDKGYVINKMYYKIRERYKSPHSTYSEERIIEDLNKDRQGSEYKNAFGYNTSYNPNKSSEIHEDVAESSQTESADDRFRHSLLQSLAKNYKNYTNRSLHISHFEAYVGNFNNARKTNYTTDEMVQLLYDEGYLTS
jgi:hypothetical protein